MASMTVNVVSGLPVGSAFSGYYVAPSGDTTGATDIAAINTAIAAHTEVWLHGSYYINAAITPGSNITLILADATILLVAGSNCNMVLNADYLNLSGGNQNIVIRGIGVALFDQNGTHQTYPTSSFAPAAAWKGHLLLLSHVQHYEVRDIQMQNVVYYGVSPQQTSDGLLSGITQLNTIGTNQNAIVQTLGGAANLVIERIRGISEDDAVSLGTGDKFTGNYADQTLFGATAGNISDVDVRDIEVTHVTASPETHTFALFTGSGCTMQRVSITNVRERYPTQNKGRMLIGTNDYTLGTFASASDFRDITISNCNTPITFAASVSSVTVTNLQIPTTVETTEPPILFGPGNNTVSDVTIDGLFYNGPAAPANALIDITAGSGTGIDRLTVKNVTVAGGGVGALIRNAGAAITNLVIDGVTANQFPLGVISATTGLIAGGRFDKITVPKPPPGANWGTTAPSVVFGPNCPAWTSADPTPVALQGSYINCDATKVLDGGTSVPATYVCGGDGGAFTRLASGASAAAFVSDTFAGTAATLLTAAHSGQTTGATWTKHPNFSGSLAPIITPSNTLRANEPSNIEFCYASGAPGGADYAVRAIVNVASVVPGAVVGVTGRMDTAASTWYLARYDGGWELYKYVAGVTTQLGSTYNAPLVPGAVAVLGLKMTGTTIQLLINSIPVITVTDSAVAAAGKAGVMFNNAGQTPTDTSSLQLSNFTAT